MKNILKCHDIVKTNIVRGQGCYLYDDQGRQYIDFESGIWCTVLGHSHPRINQAMRTQIEKLMHLGTRYPSSLSEGAAVKILELVGLDNGKCTFLSSGSEAVEFSVQTVRRITGKPLLLTFSDSYLAAYGSAGSKKANEWWLLDWDDCEHTDPGAWLTEIPFERIGGFVLEPGGSGSGFVRFPPRQLVQAIAQRVKQAGGLLVVNEVTTGMGRTGKWFGFQHYEICPDIIALGKGMGNGYPVSAVAMERSVAERLEASDFQHAQSHQNDPLGCTVVQEVIAELHEGHWIEKGKAVGAFFLEGLKRLEKHTVVKEARGRGMLLGLALYPHAHQSVQWVYERLLEYGFLVGYYSAGHVLRFDPALTIEKKDIVSLLDRLDKILGRF